MGCVPIYNYKIGNVGSIERIIRHNSCAGRQYSFSDNCFFIQERDRPFYGLSLSFCL